MDAQCALHTECSHMCFVHIPNRFCFRSSRKVIFHSFAACIVFSFSFFFFFGLLLLRSCQLISLSIFHFTSDLMIVKTKNQMLYDVKHKGKQKQNERVCSYVKKRKYKKNFYAYQWYCVTFSAPTVIIVSFFFINF